MAVCGAAMNWKRGFLRLWLVFSVLWIAFVGVVSWSVLPTDPNPPPPGFAVDKPQHPPKSSPASKINDLFSRFESKTPKRGLTDAEVGLLPDGKPDDWTVVDETKITFDDLPDAPWIIARRSQLWETLYIAAIPPTLLLVLSMALVWAGRGFRK
jgi:hypothetical protein